MFKLKYNLLAIFRNIFKHFKMLIRIKESCKLTFYQLSLSLYIY